MSGPDPIAVVALIVSLIALVLTLLQVAQQFVATANEYRHCSKRTVGGWSRKRSRRLIWRELRFEVLFATPIINIEFLPSGSMAGGDIYAVPTTRLDAQTSNEKQASPIATNLSSSRSDSVSSSVAQFIFHSPEGNQTGTSSEGLWYLNDKGTLPEAKCSWLTLLNDVAITHLQIDIKEHSLSYDFMPDGIKKPLAQMDRRSFLTLMSLFQVLWQREQGGKDTPTGAGTYCEVTSRNLVNFGAVVSYRPTDVKPASWFYIVSEKARAAMFNSFKLSFDYAVLTYSADEVYQSVLELADDKAANTVRDIYKANNGWSPGLAETIGCFAEPEMPKAIEHGTDKFVSIFSARSISSILRDYPVTQLLIGQKIENSTADAEKISKWAKDYIDFSSHDDDVRLPTDQLRAALEFACGFAETYWQKRHVGEPISWSHSRTALAMIKLLDKQLSILCHRLAPTQQEHDVQREFARLQIRFGCSLFFDARALLSQQGGSWRDFRGRVVATNYVKICSSLGEKYQKSEQVRSSLIINRLMRGVLWHIHNGNAPTGLDRQLECSLNSHWLSDTSTIWID